MIPSVLARQLERGFADYFATTFPAANEPFRSAFARMAAGQGLYLQPFTTLRLPFRTAACPARHFEAVSPTFTPWAHQERAFARLSGEDARSTIVATGTGSGKTECFLYPILDYCHRHRGEQGVKALIVYPMNALASDQAGRIARLIWENDKLKNNVTAGLYVGGQSFGGVATMGPDAVLTDHKAMIDHPPDILLTNYKMLDYLLVRGRDARIWRHNRPDTLRYAVIDEMHTFDGAQGTDLACLLRRLKSRLYMQPGSLCCVGTSATMGGPAAVEGMRAFAADVFGESFGADSVILEERLSADEFLAGRDAVYLDVPDAEALDALDAAALANDEQAYLSRAVAGFFPELAGADVAAVPVRLELGRRLPAHRMFQDVLRATGGEAFQAEELMGRLAVHYPQLSGCERPGRAADALCALVSHARTGTAEHLRPFLNVQTQLWARELARVVATVGPDDVQAEPAVNLNGDAVARRLPVVNCRECGHTAWVGKTTCDQHVCAADLSAFYSAYFDGAESVCAVWPRGGDERQPAVVGEAPSPLRARLCPSCLKLAFDDAAAPAAATAVGKCPDCGGETFPVWLAELRPSGRTASGERRSRQYACPQCGSHQGLSLVGLRTSTEAGVALSQLFASDFDDDHKVLVFSDNVQDASHRAGFFNARTWKFGLRAAMAQFVADGGEGLSLSDFGPAFTAYWRGRLTEEGYIARFTPPNNAWMRCYESVMDGNPVVHDDDYRALMGHIEQRLDYEVLLEFGLRSQTGRTLEKSCVATLVFDEDAVEAAVRDAGELLANEEGIVAGEVDLRAAVLSFLDVMRLRGAFAAPVFDDFLREGAKPFMLSNKHLRWLPGQHASGLPTFLLCGAAPKKGFDSVAAPAYAAVATRLLEACGASLLSVQPSTVVGALARGCERAGLVARLLDGTQTACWGIDCAAARVTGAAARFECDCCHTRPVRARRNAAGWEGAGCPRSGCTGTLHACGDGTSPDYYSGLFTRGLGPRVQTREHTGLLSREERERVEARFKASGADTRAGDPNVLSCTPTLEMGIDIGNLSTLLLCGVPPTQARFLQRVGRAGRRDGNALAVVLADATSRGMYYYDAPREMIAGEIEPPRVYLQAAAVLERQFTAYCLDRWVRDEGDAAQVPDHMRACLANLGKTRPEASVFPFNFLAYVKTRTELLLRTFLELFPHDLSDDSDAAAEVRRFARGGIDGESPFYLRFYEAFHKRFELLVSYKEQCLQVQGILKELQERVPDSSREADIKRAETERRAIIDVIRHIYNESVYGFLSNEGLLPNYAFPEEGVRLRTVLRRAKDDEGRRAGRRAWERTTAEYGRPAGSALSELAPGNTFYANAHRFTVDQIDLVGSKAETWRLCPDCSHAEQELESTPAKACPRCGSLAWADAGQRRLMLRLSTVVSNMDYQESFVDDSSERRMRRFFCDQLLVEVDPTDIACAVKVEGPHIDFGYEYDRRATIRQINFGEGGEVLGHEMSVAGDKRARAGFRVCTRCGKVATRDERGELVLKHGFACPVRRGVEPEGEAVVECLFLYRELSTEAVRILVPETSFASEEHSIRETFVAAVMLGMREKFGNVDHLGATVSDEPVAGSGYRKRYLVIYDTVPGGTGYLKQLSASYEEFRDVLARALAALEACPCNDDPARDGCYRCLFAYKQVHDVGSVSRERAKGILRALLSEENTVQTVGGLDEVSPNHLFDSELEQKFVAALHRLRAADGAPGVCRKEIVHAKPGYLLELGAASWEVEPQVDLGPAEGVAVPCRPDFVLWPVAGTCVEGALPVAVFTDGFAFHQDRVADDTLKREAVRRSGRFRVWTLSWSDVEAALGAGQGERGARLLDAGRLPSTDLYGRALSDRAGVLDVKPGDLGAFKLLGWYLARGDAGEAFRTQAGAYSLGLLAPVPADDAPARVSEAFSRVEPFASDPGTIVRDCEFLNAWDPGAARAVHVFAGARRCDVMEGRATMVLARLEDEDLADPDFQKSWNEFWCFWNLMQFFEGFLGVTATGLRDAVYDALDVPGEGASGDFAAASFVPEGLTAAWEEALEFAVPEARPLCERLLLLGVGAPDEVGLELDGGEMAELAWLDAKCCFLTSARADDAEAFVREGWSIIDPSAPDEVLKEQLKG